jgi:hypothetical protein
VTVPTMLGWTSQWYGYVPVVSKVKVKNSPGARNPESKTPVSEVAVWVTCPSFTQHTVPPCAIDTSAGLKKKSPIETRVEPAGQTSGTGT